MFGSSLGHHYLPLSNVQCNHSGKAALLHCTGHQLPFLSSFTAPYIGIPFLNYVFIEIPIVFVFIISFYITVSLSDIDFYTFKSAWCYISD